MGWEEAVRRIRQTDLEDWFGNKGAFCKAATEGAGRDAISAFLGGAFAKGHGVRDALAILNRPGKEKPTSPRRRPTRAGTTGRAVLGHWAEDTAAGRIAQRERRRAELVAEWVRITTDRKVAQDGPVSERGIVEGRGNKGGAREAARKLGMSPYQVSRSLKINELLDKAKAEA
jgi:hypothetical protein